MELKRTLAVPARIVPLAFLAAITTGTLLLMLPIAHVSGVVDPIAAAFTAVSATCVTGLIVVDTPTYWTTFGQVVIMLLIQVGGFGIMTLATLLTLLVSGRLPLASSLVAQAETHTLALGDVATVLRRVLISVAAAEGFIAVLLTIRFRTVYDEHLSTALWHGIFHAISAFNNAGFALYSDNMVGFVSDPWIILPICTAIIAGGIGFPVFFELRTRWRHPSSWTAHTRLTVVGYTTLLIVGVLTFVAFEWNNPGTLGPLGLDGKIIGSVAGGVFPRTAGFNSIDYGQIRPETLVINLVLMFVGGGSAGTAGGVKVTTFFLLAFVILAEMRGEEQVRIGSRAIAPRAQRQALSVALLGAGVVGTATIALVMVTSQPLERVVFETVSAFGTVGLSMNLTPELSTPARLVVMAVMFCGRVGTITVASALAFSSSRRMYHLPEEHPIVG
ncbi:TrkH family potassium uptake protein [Gephyromycinifex aptenodytis]|uniref:TrkH family potassium uptake protein n=1 Tax=Gephyromycinifex aptenodytis TaxID=2716227 RepID=UPI001D015C86|nr:potassium transporter TrkG [Gephyromycinifex aptenodytis]